jgi:hypothetical protein
LEAVVTEVALTTLIAVANGRVGFPRIPTEIGTTSTDTPGVRLARVKLYAVPLRTACSWVLRQPEDAEVAAGCSGGQIGGTAALHVEFA